MDDEFYKAAKEALSNWNIHVARLSLESKTENIVFRVEDVVGIKYVLRLHRPGYHSLEDLKSEKQWTHALTDAGIDVPIPVATRTNDDYSRVRVHGHYRYAGILKWVDGYTMLSIIEDDVDLHVTAAQFRQIGELLAKIHNQASTWTPPKDFSRHAFDAKGLMGEEPYWGRFWEARLTSKDEQHWLQEARVKIREVLTYCKKDLQVFSLIHADLHPGNVIVNGEDLHIIDFDDSGFGWHQYDLSNAIFEYRDHEQFELMYTSLVEGYRRYRYLSDQTLAYLPLFLVIRALALIGWLSDRPEHDERSYLPDLIAYAQQHLDDALLLCP